MEARTLTFLGIWCCVLVLLCRSDTPQTPACSGGLMHDPPPRTYDRMHWISYCGDTTNVSEYALHFEVPHVPYWITAVCVGIISNTPMEVSVMLTAYQGSWPNRSAAPIVFEGTMQTSRTFTRISSTKSKDDAQLYQGFDVRNSSFVAWSRHVFVGVVGPFCGDYGARLGYVPNVTSMEVFGRPSLALALVCVSPACGRAQHNPVAIRAEGQIYTVKGTEEIPGWHCPTIWFADGVTCHCGCGTTEDPDCFQVTRRSPNCSSASQICLLGACVDTGWNTSRPWCDIGQWDLDGRCSCDCVSASAVAKGTFVPDPDCRELGIALTNGACPGLVSPVCLSDTCVDQWTCAPSSFGDNTTCNCQCGSVDDRDCSVPGLPVDCPSGSACVANRCVPRSWALCRASDYSDGKSCNCQCGTYDPDCDLNSTTDCAAAGYQCSYDGICVVPGCPNGFVDPRTEKCDGGPHCLRTCMCERGYVPESPSRGGCASKCGNGIVTEGEECEGSTTDFCNLTSCLCLPCHPAVTGEGRGNCSWCGNGVVEASEECEVGWEHCDPISCECTYGLGRDGTTCENPTSRSSAGTTSVHGDSDLSVIVIVVITCGTALLAVVILSVTVLLLLPRSRHSAAAGVSAPSRVPCYSIY